MSALGVAIGRYTDRSYERTQEIADAAFLLGFDGLVAPSARWDCLNLVLFTDRIPPDQISVNDKADAIDWVDWRKRSRS